MRRPDRGVLTACGCFVTLASVQCGQNDGLSERDRSTLTIHVPDQDEVDWHPGRTLENLRGGESAHLPASQALLNARPSTGQGNAE